MDKRVAALPEQRRRLLLQRAVRRRRCRLSAAAHSCCLVVSCCCTCAQCFPPPLLSVTLQGVDPDAPDARKAGSAAPSNGWGFPTNLPPRQRLVEYLEQQQRAQHDAQQAQQAQQRPLLLELLQQSRTFQSPDCAGWSSRVQPAWLRPRVL